MTAEHVDSSPRGSAAPLAPDPAHPFIPTEFRTLAAERLMRRRPARKRSKIVHLIGSLGSGGAERQLVNFVSALAGRGQDVSILTMERLEGASAFLAPLLKDRNVGVRAVDCGKDPEFRSLWNLPRGRELIAQLPNWLKPWPLEIARELAQDPPDVLHIWLDFANIAGAIAALMVGVRRIVLSTRNVNPTHFPHMNIRWFQPWYCFLASIPDLIFVNNSAAGRDDYARWMDVPDSRFHVIHNGIDTERYRLVAKDQIAAFRDELGLSSADRIIAGVFRLADEKRPMMFLDVVESVMATRPGVHAVILGAGPMEADVRSRVQRSLFRDRIHLIPPRGDTPPVYSASSVLLQTSVVEGTPNTLLEAQSVGCPVVTTPAGGAVEALLENRTGFVADSVMNLADRVGAIVDDSSLRAALSAEGRPFIEKCFSLSRMIDETFALYSEVDDDKEAV
jgi:glycosyltransferase involved in cell wall biosynthesis